MGGSIMRTSLRALALAAVACAAVPGSAWGDAATPAPEPPSITLNGAVTTTANPHVTVAGTCGGNGRDAGVSPRLAAPDCTDLVRDPCRLARRNVAADHIVLTRSTGDELDRSVSESLAGIAFTRADTDVASAAPQCVNVSETAVQYEMATYDVSEAEAQ